MRILITTDLFTTETNGVVTSVKNLRRELEQKGHDVRILTLSEGSYSYRIGKVYYIRSLSLQKVYPDVRMPTSYHHKLLRQLITWHPDVIHSQCEFFTFQFAHHIAKHTGAPIVHTYHTLYEQYVQYVLPTKQFGDDIVSRMSQLRLKRVRRVIAPTKKVEAVLTHYGLRAPICVVPSGIRLEQHLQTMDPSERSRRRLALGIGEADTVLINIGRLGFEKNLEQVLQYFAKANRSGLHLLIVGDGPARQSLQQLAQQLGIAQQVHFTGMVPPAQVHTYYQLGDIFVAASTSETQGLTFIEAAANGLPLLCRVDPCLDEVLLEGQNGYTYTNEADFSAKLNKLIADPALRKAAGQRSRQIAQRFSTAAFGDAIEKIYQEVLEEKNAKESVTI